VYSSLNIIRIIDSRRMGEKRNEYKVLVGKPEGMRPLGRPRRRWETYVENNTKMDLREIG
jgi:hypothetical protein